jgi:hypothetical protein
MVQASITSPVTSLHDRIVQSHLKRLAAGSDLVVLAQSTMARVIEGMDPDEVPAPVISSPRRAVLQLKQVLEDQP